ncbi:hypothetical protein L1987_23090 [Smallanthus sonchifolius]|uniref:Uncharacterized protein n=1 Tax=Smallanthus sonchifolius TaxID=185202 RepID=A0ACB9II52_9ASTR|nr:hypothetical protein L1987_23090 [Smallanthus sonchifolius]
MKGRELLYTGRIPNASYILRSLKQQYCGRIPNASMRLVGLTNLNLSRNFLKGQIPMIIGYLKNLESLDLSMNKMCGRIPQSLTSLNFLIATYNHVGEDECQDDTEGLWFYGGIGLGFIVEFMGLLGNLHFIRRWRVAYLEMLEKVYGWLMVLILVNLKEEYFRIRGGRGLEFFCKPVVTATSNAGEVQGPIVVDELVPNNPDSAAPVLSGSNLVLVALSSGSYGEDSKPISSVFKKRYRDDSSSSIPSRRMTLKFRLRSTIHKSIDQFKSVKGYVSEALPLPVFLPFLPSQSDPPSLSSGDHPFPGFNDLSLDANPIKQVIGELICPSFPKGSGDHSLKGSPPLAPKFCGEGSGKASLTMDSDEEPLLYSDDFLPLSAEEKKELHHAIPDKDLLYHRALRFKSLGGRYCVFLYDGFVKGHEVYHRLIWFEKAFMKRARRAPRLKDELVQMG